MWFQCLWGTKKIFETIEKSIIVFCYPGTMFAKILLVWLAFAVMLWVMLAGVLIEKHIKTFKESLEKEEIVAMSVY